LTAQLDHAPAPPRAPDSGVQSSPVQPDDGTQRAQPRARAYTRARDTVKQTSQKSATVITRYTGRGILNATPATPAAVLRRTKTGGWVPGDHAAWVELTGKIYGYLIAFPITCAAYLAVWFTQAPTRLVAAAALYAGMRWAL
jgi:hypothetical protein